MVGGIFNEGSSTLILTDSNLNNNNAMTGGAIENYDSTADVNFCRIIGNSDNQSIYIYNTDGGTVNATNNWWGSNNSPSGEVSGKC